jgi:hypothetical protein
MRSSQKGAVRGVRFIFWGLRKVWVYVELLGILGGTAGLAALIWVYLNGGGDEGVLPGEHTRLSVPTIDESYIQGLVAANGRASFVVTRSGGPVPVFVWTAYGMDMPDWGERIETQRISGFATSKGTVRVDVYVPDIDVASRTWVEGSVTADAITPKAVGPRAFRNEKVRVRSEAVRLVVFPKRERALLWQIRSVSRCAIVAILAGVAMLLLGSFAFNLEKDRFLIALMPWRSKRR